MDAEFVQTSGVTNLDRFPFDSMASINQYTIQPTNISIQGATVKFSNQGITNTCSVTSASASAVFNGDGSYSDLIKTNCASVGGNSGGVVITSIGLNTSARNLYAIGIVKGGSGSTTYVVKANKIMASLGLSR